MKTCTIYQPSGIGDIIWVQPIVDFYISKGYKIFFPVCDIYIDLVKTYIEKENLIWCKESDDYPLKEFKDQENICNIIQNDNIFLGLIRADRFLPHTCPLMTTKYYAAGLPIINWHNNLTIKRNIKREKKVFEVYNIDENKPFILINKTFGTPPIYKKERNGLLNQIKSNKNNQIIVSDYETNTNNDINLFDWIGVIEKAYEIHSVETAFCYLIDKYSNNEAKIFMYEKRLDDEPNIFFHSTSHVYRNKNWIYMQ
jgi:hypothetical protein